MGDFKVIETQEQLDEIIKNRLQRAESTWAEKYKDYMSPDDVAAQTADLNRQITDLSNSLDNANEQATASAAALAERDAKIKSYETASVKSRIAHEVGIPYELANRLSGETEEDIRKDAEALKPLVSQRTAPPLRDSEAKDSAESKSDGLKKLSDSLKKE